MEGDTVASLTRKERRPGGVVIDIHGVPAGAMLGMRRTSLNNEHSSCKEALDEVGMKLSETTLLRRVRKRSSTSACSNRHELIRGFLRTKED